jgi:hypothetical protein
MLMEEDCEIRDMTNTLKNCVEITCITEICKTDLTLLGVLGFHAGRYGSA